MKIVHVVESLAVGGLEHVVLTLADWQHRRGNSVRIVCLFEEGALAASARHMGLDVVATGKRPGLDLAALMALRSAIGSFRPDVVHTHNAVAHYYAAAATMGLRVQRLVNTRHGMGPRQSGSRLDRLYRLALARTHAAVSVCHAGRDRFIETGVMPAAKAVIVPNGVAVERIEARNDAARRALLLQLGRPTDATVIGIVGRLSAVKDHATLLHGIAMLRLSSRPVELVIVGDGEMRGPLQTLADSLPLGRSVHFLGMRHDVARLLPAFDIFALPSLSEGYSLALVEAAAAALPIVATRVGGNADIVADGLTGLLVPPSEPSQLSSAFARLVDNVPERESMGSRARRWALAHGTIDAMGLAYQDLYAGEAITSVQQRISARSAAAHAEA